MNRKSTIFLSSFLSLSLFSSMALIDVIQSTTRGAVMIIPNQPVTVFSGDQKNNLIFSKNTRRLNPLYQEVALSSETTSPSATPVELINTDSWKTFKNQTYQFEIKYPPAWEVLRDEKITDADFDYEYWASLGLPDALQTSTNQGFSIYVFRTDQCKTPMPNDPTNTTDGTPAIKRTALGDSLTGSPATPQCTTHKTQVNSATVGTIDVPLYEFSSQGYTYTIIPFIQNEGVSEPDPIIQTIIDSAIKSFSFNPTASPPKLTPKSIAPKPKPILNAKGLNNYKLVGGKYMCPHPGRKPHKSDKQGNHVDEDCCPDPDEWPHPACSYSAKDYSIMLKR